MIKLNLSSGASVNLNPNSTSQCFEVELPLSDQYADNTSIDPLRLCLELMPLDSDTKCVYIPEPCVEITVSGMQARS